MTTPRIGKLLRWVPAIAVCFMVVIGAVEAKPVSVTTPTSPKPSTVSVQNFKSVDEGDALADLAQIFLVKKLGREAARQQRVEDLVNSVQDKVMAGVERGGVPVSPKQSSLVDRLGNGLKSVGTGLRNFLGLRPSSPSPPASTPSTRPVSPGSWTSRPGMAAAPAAVGGPRLTLPSPRATDMITTTSEEDDISQIESKIGEVLAGIPRDTELDAKNPVERFVTSLGKVVYAKTVLAVPAIGIHTHQAACDNAILVERTPAEGGGYSSATRPFTEFYDNIPYQRDTGRMAKAVEAMTSIQEGIRCLSNPDMSAFESVYVSTLIDTYEDLIHDGKTIMARLLIDNSLPLLIQISDAVKYFQTPNSFRVFHLKKDPIDGEGTFGLMEFLLDEGKKQSTLHHFGIWLENPFEGGRMQLAKLRGLNIWWPLRFIQNISNLLKLGEGDCSYLEMSSNTGDLMDAAGRGDPFSCRTNLTCEMMGPSLESLKGGLRAPTPSTRTSRGGGFSTGTPTRGAGSVLDSVGEGRPAARPPAPGDRGSPLTHFGTNRSDIASQCSGGGGGGGTPPPQEACADGWPQRSSRGKMSADPEMARVYECTIRSIAGAPTPTIGSGREVETNFHKNPFCRQQVGDPPEGHDASTRDATAHSDDEDAIVDQNIADRAQTIDDAVHGRAPPIPGNKEIARNLMNLPNRLMESMMERGLWVPQEELERAMDQATAELHQTSADSDLDKDRSVAPGLLLAGDTQHHRESRSNTISVDRQVALDGGNELTKIMVHEFLHAVINHMVDNGVLPISFSPHTMSHGIIRGTGFGGRGEEECGDSGKCNDSCGHEDNVMTRFADCALEGGPPRVPPGATCFGPGCPPRVGGGGGPGVDANPLTYCTTPDGGNPACRAYTCGEVGLAALRGMATSSGGLSAACGCNAGGEASSGGSGGAHPGCAVDDPGCSRGPGDGSGVIPGLGTPDSGLGPSRPPPSGPPDGGP